MPRPQCLDPAGSMTVTQKIRSSAVRTYRRIVALLESQREV